MKISYVYHLDASCRTIQSGRPAAIYETLLTSGCEVQAVFPLRDDYLLQRWTQKLFWHSLGRQYLFYRHPGLLRSYARQVATALARECGDVVFCPGTLTISNLNVEAPITFCSDASFASLLNYYGAYTRLAPGLKRTAEETEAATLNNAALAIYPSDWAAGFAIKHYGLDPGRVAVVPFGANLGGRNTETEVAQWIEARRFDTLRLLFIGREWDRKGGDLVISTARLLAQRGLTVRVDVVGPKRIPASADLPYVHLHGSLDAGTPEGRASLAAHFRDAHLLFVPSRAEAFGLVFSEASAFGVPVISTSTGGIPGAIRNDVNGHLLSLDATPAEYADTIERILADPDQYRALALRSYHEFKHRLSWEVFCSRYIELVRERVLFQRPARSGTKKVSPCIL